MQMPSQNADTLFEELLQDLPPEIEEMAREFKAFSRSRKVKTAGQLLRAVFLYSGLDKSLRDTAGNLTLTISEIGEISDTAVAKRLEASRAWLKAALPKMLGLGRQDISTLEGIEGIEGVEGYRLLVVDGSQIQFPGQAIKGHYRLHLCMNLRTLEFVEIKITDNRVAEGLKNYSLKKGDLVIADRGYSNAKQIIDAVDKGAETIVRHSAHNVVLYDRNGEKIDLAKKLKTQAFETTRSFEAVIKSGNKELKITLHAYRLSKQQAALARRKARRKSQRKGRSPKEKVLFLAGWVMVLSSLSQQVISSQMVMELYRVRWQIEMAIKRWKSLLDAGQLRNRLNSPLAQTWIYGKMLFALMLERRARRKLGQDWGFVDRQRTASWWRGWKVIKDEIEAIVTASVLWPQNLWQSCLKVLAERTRRRKLQALPKDALVALKIFYSALTNSVKVAA